MATGNLDLADAPIRWLSLKLTGPQHHAIPHLTRAASGAR